MGRPLPRPLEVVLDRFTRVVGWELEAPVVCVSVMDAKQRLTTSAIGAPPSVALLMSWPFAKHVAPSGPMLVGDARQDARLAGCPTVRDGTVTAYLGVRLTTLDGHAVGTLSVMDSKPRRWTAGQLAFVQRLCARITDGVEPGTTATSM